MDGYEMNGNEMNGYEVNGCEINGGIGGGGNRTMGMNLGGCCNIWIRNI